MECRDVALIAEDPPWRMAFSGQRKFRQDGGSSFESFLMDSRDLLLIAEDPT